MDLVFLKVHPHTKICAKCACKFVSDKSIEPFCSEKCNRMFEKDRQNEQLWKLKTDQYCVICKHPFKPKGYQTTCSEKCEKQKATFHEKLDNELYEIKCNCCGTRLRKDANTKKPRLLCFSCTKQNQKLERKKIAKPYAQQWIDKKELKGRSVSYEGLNRRAEYRRVFGEGAWDNYERGKRWDKI